MLLGGSITKTVVNYALDGLFGTVPKGPGAKGKNRVKKTFKQIREEVSKEIVKPKKLKTSQRKTAPKNPGHAKMKINKHQKVDARRA